MLSSIFPSKVLASDKLKKYGMGGLVGALGTSLLTFLFSVRVRNCSAKNHGQDNFECFQASALVCCLWSALRQGQEDIAMEEAVMIMGAMLAMWAMKTTMTTVDMVMEDIVT